MNKIKNASLAALIVIVILLIVKNDASRLIWPNDFTRSEVGAFNMVKLLIRDLSSLDPQNEYPDGIARDNRILTAFMNTAVGTYLGDFNWIWVNGPGGTPIVMAMPSKTNKKYFSNLVDRNPIPVFIVDQDGFVKLNIDSNDYWRFYSVLVDENSSK